MKNRLTFIIVFFSCLALSLTSQEYVLMDELDKSDRLRAESKFDSALIVLRNANLRALETNDLEFLTRTNIGFGSLYIELRKIELAIEHYTIAISHAKKGKIKNLENRALFGIGVAHQVQNNLDSALFYYDLTQQAAIDLGDMRMASDMLNNISSINSRRGNSKVAIEKSLESLALNLELQDMRYVGRNYQMLGIIYRRVEKYDSSEYFFDKGLQIADSLNYRDDELEVYRQFGVLYRDQGDYKRAYEVLRLYSSKAARVYSEENNDKLMKLRQEFETASLELKNEIQENQLLAKTRFQIITVVVSASLIIIISIWLYIVDQRRKSVLAIAEKNDQINKQKIDELLQEQEIASLQGVLEGQETERKRVAIDLHDRLGGILSMVKLHFSAVEEKIEKENPNKEKFLTASELLDLAAGEVRNISHDMMSGVLAKFGLIPALEDLKTRISETGKLDLNLYVNIKDNLLSGEQELQLYRIVQELISNILKHSQATETNIQLNQNEGSVNLIVEDDGVGFDPKRLENADGIGLSNLKARVAKLEGTFHVDSGKGAGTTISIDIPVEND